MSSISVSRIFLNSCAVAIGGVLIVASTQSAQAAHGDRGPSFKEFRQQNQGLDRHALRKMFNAERRAGNPNQPTILPIYTLTQGADGIGSTTTLPQGGNNRENRVQNNVRNQSTQVSGNGGVIRLSSGVNLDLTSQERNITLGQNLFDSVDSIEISVNGQNKTLAAGSKVSAAEYIAAKQVLAGGAQKIVIDGSGRASGGDVDLGAITANNDVMRASDFVVASNVTTYGDFSKHSDFRLLGNLDNFGTVHALSSDENVKGGAIRAEDINNHAGALIKSAVDLTLEANGNLNNDGVIISNGALTLNAAALSNNGAIGADGHVDLNSDAVANKGLIKSFSGNVNLNGADAKALNVDNNGGTLSALNGAINVRGAEYGGSYDSNLYGGDLASKELNVNAGTGLASVDVHQLTGIVNQKGTAAHVRAATDVLSIGQVCLTGDPTYYNTTGDINVAGNIDVQENLVIAAAGEITVANGVTIHAGNASQGFNITFVAGASILPNGGSDQTTIGPIPPPNANNGAISMNGKASKIGGGILVGSGVTIDASSTDAIGNDNAGFIQMFTFGGKEGTDGTIDLSGATVTAKGKNAGNNGALLVWASNPKPTVDVVKIGKVDLNGGTGTFGPLDVRSGETVTAKKQTVDFDANGVRTSQQSFQMPLKNLNKSGTITITDPGAGVDIDSGDVIFIRGGSNIDIQGDMRADLGVVLSTSGAITMGASADPITTTGNISIEQGAVGTLTDPLRVASISIVVDGGVDVFVDVDPTIANFQYSQRDALGNLVLHAPNTKLKLSSFDDVSAQTIDLIGKGFQIQSDVVAKGQVSLFNTDVTPLVNGDLTASIITPKLDLAGNIGANANNRFNLPFGIKEITHNVGDAFLTNLTSDKITLSQANDSNLVFRSSGSFAVGNIITTSGTGIVDFGTTAGTITILEGSGVNGKNGVSIVHTGTDSKSKIVLEASSSISTSAKSVGLGNVNISIGATGSATTTPENIQVVSTGGTVSFLGTGAVAKEPVNTLTAQGANITVNNGVAAKNLSFGGDVNILADPPVAPGTPTIIYEATTSQRHSRFPVTTSYVTSAAAITTPASLSIIDRSIGIDTYLMLGATNNTINAIATSNQFDQERKRKLEQ